MNQIPATDAFALSRPPKPTDPILDDILGRIAAGSSERDAKRLHPFEAIGWIKNARLGAVGIAIEEGGAGASQSEIIGLVLRLAAADSNVAHILRNHYTFIERYVRLRASPKQEKWLKAALEGAIFGLATTEIDRTVAGGGGVLHTTLSRGEGGWRLDGTKYYSTGSLYADYILVRAEAPEEEGQVSIVVPAAREGVELVDDWDGVGQRVTGTGTTNFRNVFVADDEVLRDADAAPYLLPYTSTIAQLIVTTVVAGNIFAALRDARELVRNRKRVFYYAQTPNAANDPLLQKAVGEIASFAFASEAAVLAAAARLDLAAAARDRKEDIDELAHDASVAAAKAKVVVDELAFRATTRLFDVGGASAATQRYNLDRHWRNVRTLASHNPTDLKTQWIGNHELNGVRLPTKGFF